MNAMIPGAMVVATLALAFATSAAELQRPVQAKRVIDLTHEMHEDMSYWPGGVPFSKERLLDYGDHGYRLHRFVLGENTGTHVDAPMHFIEGGAGITAIPLEDLIVPAVVIDVQDKVAQNPDYLITVADLEAFEAEHGKIPAGSLVIANTGWHEKFGDLEQYAGMDDAKVLHFPGFHPGAAGLLIERDVVGVGIDTLSLDHGPATDFPFHNAMLGAGKYLIENLTNLDAMPPTGATVIIGVLPVREASQAQARVLAFLPR